VKKYDKLILVVLLLVFGTGIFMTARSAFDQYVTFAYAQEVDRSVQVRGKAIEGTLEISDEDNFTFDMQDLEGTVVRVYRNDSFVPVSLFEAEYIVVKGKADGDIFNANTILVKCPSKYEAADE
jgi:cytochrome c-type biogenesis protein CcmE